MHRYRTAFSPQANPESIIRSENSCYRITVLTNGLIRLEWSSRRIFEDRASTFAVHRDLPTPKYRLKDNADELQITTSRLRLSYDKKAFSASGLTVQVLGSMTNYDSIWRYGNKVVDLGGTARTLDEVDGRTELGSAVVSRSGYAVIDDSESMLFDADGWVAPAHKEDHIDIYVFAYGHDYHAAVKALYCLSGSQPLLPRAVLGNWWSRYYAYTEQEYLGLMDKFHEKSVPLSVAVIDMDWHLVRQDVCKEAGVSGWTGYTWDRSLFPDPARFGEEIHKRGLLLTLNDHPADGVHSYEEPYERLASHLGHDTSTKDPIPFDITDKKFCDAFFDILHRQVEDDSGCDFWWIDWQQGAMSKIPGIDPLWMLNHFHYLDNTRPGSQPLTFSRFAGPGSHRYPVGFSGDSIVTWDSLRFQPEFTNCASNIGYGWWSHDIGGHMQGKKDDELQTRWVQYGVFSPIMRLHSTANPWNTKEPWRFGLEHEAVQIEFLRLRHKMVPYIQTMNILASQEDGLPLCQPMYWSWPAENEAYEVSNQYKFGTDLIVAPITSPRNRITGLARTKAWLPAGTYVDVFTGTVYDGDRLIWLHRGLNQYPVLASKGSIIPFDGSADLKNGCPIPQNVELLLVPGADANFELLEEVSDKHGIASTTSFSKTVLTYSHTQGELTIAPPSVSGPHETRSWTIRLLACQATASKVSVTQNGQQLDVTAPHTADNFQLHLRDISIDQTLKIKFGSESSDSGLVLKSPSYRETCSNILSAAQVEYDLKERIWKALTQSNSRLHQTSRMNAIDMDGELRDALLELVLARDD